MSDYRFPYKDAEFLINELLDFDRMCLDAGLEEVNSELASAILEEAGRFGSEVLAPLNTLGDEQGPNSRKTECTRPRGLQKLTVNMLTMAGVRWPARKNMAARQCRD